VHPILTGGGIVKNRLIIFFLILTVIMVGGYRLTATTPAPAANGIELNVAAAASLQDVLQEIEGIYTAKHPEVKITFNFAACGTLSRQIAEGAPVDLFISADVRQMDILQEQGIIIPDSRQDLLGNDLVLIAGRNSALQGWAGLTDPTVRRISIGAPETVPAGRYAMETLTSLKLYEQVRPKLVFAGNVRQVLTYVQTGNADAGLVYKSDTHHARDIRVVMIVPANLHKPIVYSMAIIKSSKNQSAIKSWADFLTSPEARTVFSKYGFIPLRR